MFFAVLPTVAGFGATWALLATRKAGISLTARRLAWVWVIALAVMPGVTSGTSWPFQLRFQAARSDLERMADQVVAGQAVSFPRNAGPFRIAASRVDRKTGGVALLTDTNPSGPSGFVRHNVPQTGPYGCFDPIRGDWYHLGLGGGWCYHEED